MPGARRILTHPHEALRRKARPVERFGPSLVALGDDLLATLYACGGLGIAAPQVDVGQRVIVVRGHPEARGLVLVNPEVRARAGSSVLMEGCLSVPGAHHSIVRAGRVEVAALDVRGRPLTLPLDGLLAHVFQHEFDHLDGVLFLDRAEPQPPRVTPEDFRKLEALQTQLDTTASDLAAEARALGLEDT